MKRDARQAAASLLGCLLVSVVCIGHAAEFRTVVEPAILYDAPSLQAVRRFVLGRGNPVLILVKLDAMSKVRDSTGDIGWIENKTLGDAQTVVVSAATADVHASAAADSTVLFRVEKGVLLEVDEPPAKGWLKVRHRDGGSGYVKVSDIWGLPV
jgi:SH3-like domain-containing protein